jgi:hypothetical protein
LLHPFFEPFNVMAYASRPAVLKTADFPGVSLNNLIIAAAEKRRVKIDNACALRFQGFEDFKVVPKDKFINRHILYLPFQRFFVFAAGTP